MTFLTVAVLAIRALYQYLWYSMLNNASSLQSPVHLFALNDNWPICI